MSDSQESWNVLSVIDFPFAILQDFFSSLFLYKYLSLPIEKCLKSSGKSAKQKPNTGVSFSGLKKSIPSVASPSSGEAEELQRKDEDSLSLWCFKIRIVWKDSMKPKEIGPSEVAHALKDRVPTKPPSPSDFCAFLSHRGSCVTWRSSEFPYQALFCFILFCFEEQKL